MLTSTAPLKLANSLFEVVTPLAALSKFNSLSQFRHLRVLLGLSLKNLVIYVLIRYHSNGMVEAFNNLCYRYQAMQLVHR